MNFRFCCLIVIFGFLFSTIQLQAQQIIIDKPVKAGELTLFPEMGNENVYYYLSDKLRLATDENGKPQFSFLKYVDNIRSAPGADDIREGSGGGILHFVISLSVTPEQLSEAKNALRQINSEGTVKGPVIYSGGTMTIVSSFANTEGELSKQVVGIGRAPLIDGQKAAVSMELTKKGAKILWESFKTPNPDISFSFEMELNGYRSPKQAIIEANFDKMYSHHGFQAGAVGNYGNVMFGGEIELAFDELKNDGAIKITNMGSDAEMDKLIESAYNKLTSMMFNPIGTGNPVVQGLMKSITGQKSGLDRATELYNKNKKATPAKKTTTKKKTSFITKPYNDYLLLACNNLKYSTPGYLLNYPSVPDEWKVKHIKEIAKDFIRLLLISDAEKNKAIESIDEEKYINFAELVKKSNESKGALAICKEYFRQFLLSDDEKKKYSKILDGGAVPEDFMNLVYSRTIEIIYAQDFINDEQKSYILDIAPPDTSVSWDNSLTLTYIALINRNGIVYMPENAKYAAMVKKIDDLKDMPLLPMGELEDKAASDSSLIIATSNNDKKESKESDKTSKAKPTGAGAVAVAASSTKNDPQKKSNDKKKPSTTSTKKSENKKEFKMAVMASYEFKKIKQKGTIKINMNKYTADKLTLRFDENIGKVDCDACFFEVNLDDPMFKQREIVAILDGFNYDDFGKYINYVNLKMKKTHQNGEVTVDEVRIDRDNFMKSANNFKLLYGWKGDDDRAKWFDYEIQTQWSFFGGNEVSEDWEKVNTNIVNLAAPYLHKTIELEADPDLLKDNQVRSVSVKIFYKVGDTEQVKQVSLLPSRNQYSGIIDVMLPGDNLNYDYEISWRMFGNKSKTTGRQTSSESILFVDEL